MIRNPVNTKRLRTMRHLIGKGV